MADPTKKNTGETKDSSKKKVVKPKKTTDKLLKTKPAVSKRKPKASKPVKTEVIVETVPLIDEPKQIEPLVQPEIVEPAAEVAALEPESTPVVEESESQPEVIPEAPPEIVPEVQPYNPFDSHPQPQPRFDDQPRFDNGQSQSNSQPESDAPQSFSAEPQPQPDVVEPQIEPFNPQPEFIPELPAFPDEPGQEAASELQPAIQAYNPFDNQSESQPAPTFEEQQQPFDAQPVEPEYGSPQLVQNSNETDDPVIVDQSDDVSLKDLEPAEKHGFDALAFAEKIAKFFANFGSNAGTTIKNLFSKKESNSADFGESKLQGFKNFFAKIFGFIKFKSLILLAILIGIGYFGYYSYQQKLYQPPIDFVVSFFKPKPKEIIEVKYDTMLARQWGIISSAIFANNQGSNRDNVLNYIFVSDFFGGLKDPMQKGETGISASDFYGKLKDNGDLHDPFVGYVKQLQTIQVVYSLDIYKSLDQTTQRADKLLDYIRMLNDTKTKGDRTLAEINVNSDEILKSFDSLSADKVKFEQDFFDSLDLLLPEKSDYVLKTFIDVSQKQAALKARYNALKKLAVYYQTALKKLATRIEVVDKNHEALINGIHVFDIPGSNVPIIIRNQ